MLAQNFTTPTHIIWMKWVPLEKSIGSLLKTLPGKGICCHYLIQSKVQWALKKIFSKANSMLSILRKTFVSKDADDWKRLYLIYVKPHLEFSISVWCPYAKKDIGSLEKVQRRATKLPHEMKYLSYPTRCSAMGLRT